MRSLFALWMSMVSDEGDKSFVETLYDKYAGRMYALAYGILKNKQDAEDCVHDTVIVVIEHLDRFRNLEGDHLKRLLAVVCRNLAKTRYRDNQRRRTVSLTVEGDDGLEELELVDESADVARIVVNEENAALLHALVEALDDKYRDVIALKYYYGMSTAEIAAMLNCTESVVRMRLTRAKRMLWNMGGERLC